MMTSSFLRARVFERAPRLSCIKSAIECLVHREFHGHKRPACAVSHNLRVVAKRGRVEEKERGTVVASIERRKDDCERI